MNISRIVSVIAACFILFALVIPVSGESGITVNGADTLRTIDVAPSTSLNSLLDEVQARIDIQYANNLRRINLSELPTPFQSLLGEVLQRVVTQYANNTRHFTLATPPNGLQTSLADITARVVFQYANTNRQDTLVYPRELLNDTVAPEPSAIEFIVELNEARITWATNEFARCDLRYGTQSGNYTEVVENSLYENQHNVLLDDLMADTTYYGQVICTDQSENAATSSEFTFERVSEPDEPDDPTNRLSLPQVKR